MDALPCILGVEAMRGGQGGEKLDGPGIRRADQAQISEQVRRSAEKERADLFLPIWVGGGYPLRGPMERAARWDGACLYKHPPGAGEQRMTPEDTNGAGTGTPSGDTSVPLPTLAPPGGRSGFHRPTVRVCARR
jgi:hypothetical protein